MIYHQQRQQGLGAVVVISIKGSAARCISSQSQPAVYFARPLCNAARTATRRVMSKLFQCIFYYIFYYAAAYICLALVERACLVGASSSSDPCSMDLLWPPPDAITLLAPDSDRIPVYLKSAGNCSRFLTRGTGNGIELEFSISVYSSSERREDQERQIARASELKRDLTPMHFLLMRTPLLSKPSELSIWSAQLMISWPNVAAWHEPDALYMTIELHMQTGMGSPAALLGAPVAAINLRLFGKPSSYLHDVIPRYTAIPGYVCSSSCGAKCFIGAESHDSAQLLRSFESPVCITTAHAFKQTRWALSGPAFTLTGSAHALSDGAKALSANVAEGDETAACGGGVAVVSIEESGAAHGRDQEIVVQGPGRHRLLSAIAAVLLDAVGFILIKTQSANVDGTRVRRMIRKLDLTCGYPVIAFQHRGMHALGAADHESHEMLLADFGTIDDGILLSRAAAELMIMAANDHATYPNGSKPPAACSEFAIFSDAWLCWCASSLEVPALDVRFSDAAADSKATDSLFAKLEQLYSQEQSSANPIDPHAPPVSFPPNITDSPALRFRNFVQRLASDAVASLRVMDSLTVQEQCGSTFFWGEGCSHALADLVALNASRAAESSKSQLHAPAEDHIHPIESHTAKGTIMSHNPIAVLPDPLLDNLHLPLVTSSNQLVVHTRNGAQHAASIAWIVAGVWRGERSVETLHNLRDHVCAGLGPGNVHFYFIISNTEDEAESAMSSHKRREIRKFIEDTLPAGSVMLVIFQENVDHSGWIGRGPISHQNPEFCNFYCSEVWCSRLQTAYNYITATESVQMYRYAFVVYSRIDAQYSDHVAPAQTWHGVIPERGIAGSSWKSGRVNWDGGKDDTFFIMRRCHAASALLHFPAFTYRYVKREVVSSSIKDRAAWGHIHCWPEAAVAYFFTKSQWSAASMQAMDLCELGLVGSLKVLQKAGLKTVCP
jgi:hypothetical protein